MGFDPPSRTSPAAFFMRSSNSLHGGGGGPSEPNNRGGGRPSPTPARSNTRKHPTSFHSSSPNVERRTWSSTLPNRQINSDFGGRRRTRQMGNVRRAQDDSSGFMPELPFNAGANSGPGVAAGAARHQAHQQGQPQQHQGRLGRLSRRPLPGISHAVPSSASRGGGRGGDAAGGRGADPGPTGRVNNERPASAAPTSRRPMQPPGVAPLRPGQQQQQQQTQQQQQSRPKRGPLQRRARPADNMILVDEKDKRSYTRAMKGASSVDSADNIRRRDPSSSDISPTCIAEGISPRSSKSTLNSEACGISPRDTKDVLNPPTCATEAQACLSLSPQHTKSVHIKLRPAPPPPPRQSPAKQSSFHRPPPRRSGSPSRRGSQNTNNSATATPIVTPKTMCSNDGNLAMNAMRSLANANKIKLPLTSSPQRRQHGRHLSDIVSERSGGQYHARNMSEGDFDRSSGSKLQMYPPPPPRNSKSVHHPPKTANPPLVRRSRSQEDLAPLSEESNEIHKKSTFTLLSDILESTASSSHQPQGPIEAQREPRLQQEDTNLPDAVEGNASYLNKTRRQLNHAQDVIALANPASPSAMPGAGPEQQHQQREQQQKQQAELHDDNKSAALDEPEQHKGFRTDYLLGETARAASHMVIESNPAKATELVNTLNNHDFAFIKRSDGSYSYAILAYRTNEMAAAAMAAVNEPTLDALNGSPDPSKGSGEGRSSNQVVEDSMTFVLSSAGCTKMISKSQWAEFIRLVSPSAEEDDNGDADQAGQQQQSAGKGVKDELIEVKSEHDVEEYLKKLRQEFYSTRPVTVGEGWQPPTTISWNDEEDDCISCVSTQSDLLALTDEHGNRIGSVENVRYTPSQPIILE